VVVGYGMAALLLRAFWPESRPSAALGLSGIGLYLWLGLAISGPIILLRPCQRRSVGLEPRRELATPRSRTGAELAWLLIGVYWIVLGLFVIPSRLHEFKLGDMVLFGLIPIVVAVGFRLFGPKAPSEHQTQHGWTHRAAIVLLVTWPIAWICLILLGRALR